MELARLSHWSMPIILMLAGLVGQTGEAAEIRYTSFGINDNAINGSNPTAVRFQGVDDGSFDPSGPLNLGRFIVTPPPQGTSVTYQGALFRVAFDSPDYPRRTVIEPDPIPPGTPYSDLKITEYIGSFIVSGKLTGTVSGDGRSDLEWTLYGADSVPLFVYPTDQRKMVSYLPFPVTDDMVPRTLHLSSGAGESNALVAQVVPEPSMLAVFGLVAAGLVVRHRRS